MSSVDNPYLEYIKMKNINSLVITLGLLLASGMSMAAKGGDPIISKVMIDQFEVRDDSGESTTVLEGQAWIGKDLNKLWLKLDSDYENSDEYESELQLLYSKAVLPYWDLQLGLRNDSSKDETNNFAVLGIQGLAPYYFETDAATFVSEDGDISARVSFEYELLFTQKLILSPEISFNIHAQDDAQSGIGSGLASSNMGLRLRYELAREFAPYLGINQDQLYGKTADYAKAAGIDSRNNQWVIGVRAWF